MSSKQKRSFLIAHCLKNYLKSLTLHHLNLNFRGKNQQYDFAQLIHFLKNFWFVMRLFMWFSNSVFSFIVSFIDHLTCLIRCLITRTSSLWAESKDGNSPWWDDILSKTTPWRLTNRFKVRFSSLNSCNGETRLKIHCQIIAIQFIFSAVISINKRAKQQQIPF